MGKGRVHLIGAEISFEKIENFNYLPLLLPADPYNDLRSITSIS